MKTKSINKVYHKDMPYFFVDSKMHHFCPITYDILNYERITQAFMCNNRPVYNSVPLCEAIRKWCKRYNVEWDGHEDDDYAF